MERRLHILGGVLENRLEHLDRVVEVRGHLRELRLIERDGRVFRDPAHVILSECHVAPLSMVNMQLFHYRHGGALHLYGVPHIHEIETAFAACAA